MVRDCLQIARSLNEILDLSLQLCTLLSYGLQLTERDLAQAGKIGKVGPCFCCGIIII